METPYMAVKRSDLATDDWLPCNNVPVVRSSLVQKRASEVDDCIFGKSGKRIKGKRKQDENIMNKMRNFKLEGHSKIKGKQRCRKEEEEEGQDGAEFLEEVEDEAEGEKPWGEGEEEGKKII